MAKIEPLTDPLAFMDLLDKSGLLDAEGVAAVRKTAAGQPDAATLARQLVKDGSLTKWQAYQLLLGTSRLTVGTYRLLDQIGKGPLGRVYLAEHGKLGKKVALKVLSARFSSQPQVLKQFLEEANRAGALNHRNILHIFDAGNENERYYLVVEYVEGKDLQRIVDAQGPLPPARAIDLIRQAAEGLAHAHEQQLLHGDLKPSNLLVDGSGVVKILDLGLSGLANFTAPAGSEESTEAASLASLAYRAPELLQGDRPSDVRSDLYSLGAVLHFLLTGKPPSREGAARLEEVSGAPPELLNLCDHLLAANREERPESAPQVAAALDLASRALPAEQVEKLPERPTAERPSSAGKQKRPLVARPLQDAESEAPVVVAAAEEPGDSDGDPLAGFSIKTGRKRKAATATAAAPAAAKATAPAPAAKSPEGATSKSRLPLILTAAIGGGVLVLAALVTIMVLVLNRSGAPELASADRGQSPAAAATTTQTSAKTAASDANPEANPELSPESNPSLTAGSAKAVSPQDLPAPADGAQAPAAGGPSPPASDKSAAPMPAATTTPDPTAKPAATDAEQGKPADTKPAETKPAETKPAETKPAETKPAETEPAKTTPAPAPAANPFEGFQTALALPALEVMGKPAPDAMAPVVLGPVKIEPNALCIIKLKGGESAFRGSSKFSLEPAEQGTAERDWEFKLQNDNDPPIVIATMSLKEDQLAFQWSEAAGDQQAAPYLGNCVLSMAAGAGSHQVALRKPVVVDPIAATIDKGTISERYNLDYPPGSKEIAVEIGPLEGGPAKQKVDPKTELEAFKDTTYLFAGNADDALLLGFKIDVSMSAKALQITAQPQFMLGGMPRPERYQKNTSNQLAAIAAKSIQAATFNAQLATKIPNKDAKKKAEERFKGDLELAQKGMAQVEQLKEIAKLLQEGGKLHFRAYYLADDAKVELISTGGPPAAPPMPMPAAK